MNNEWWCKCWQILHSWDHVEMRAECAYVTVSQREWLSNDFSQHKRTTHPIHPAIEQTEQSWTECFGVSQGPPEAVASGNEAWNIVKHLETWLPALTPEVTRLSNSGLSMVCTVCTLSLFDLLGTPWCPPSHRDADMKDLKVYTRPC